MTSRALLALVCALACLGCAAARQPSQTALVARAPGAPAAQYTDAAAAEAARTEGQPSAALAAAVQTTARAHGCTLVGDERLAALADFAATQADGGEGGARADLIEAAGRHLGLYDPAFDVVTAEVSGDDPMRALREALAPWLAQHAHGRYGAVLRKRAQRSVLTLLLAARPLHLSPVPREHPVGSSLALRGRLPAEHDHPYVLASGARIAAGEGADFDVQVPLPQAGAQRVELFAQGPRGEVALATLLVYVGVPAKTLIELPRQQRIAADLGQLRSALLSRINAERARSSLAALAPAPELDAVCERHSQDMIHGGFVGHDSPRSGTAADRAAAAGFGRLLVLENIARGHDADSLHAAQLAEPGQKSNLLRAEITHVGIGLGALAGDARALLATVLFVRRAAAIDPAAAEPALLSQLNEARSRRAAAPLALDPALAEVARAAVRRFFADPKTTHAQLVEETNRELARFSVAYRRVSAVFALVQDVAEAASLEPALDHEVGAAGIGIAQGTRSEQQGQSIAVLIALGWPR